MAVRFSESIVNFSSASQLVVSAEGSLVVGVPAVIGLGNGEDYHVAFSGIIGDGIVRLEIGTNSMIEDLSGNLLVEPDAFGLALVANSTYPIYYADADGTNPVPPYSSWQTAATNLQDALAFAESGTEVWVADGTYYPDRSFNQRSGSRNASFRLSPGLKIIGGFAGHETALEQRHPDPWHHPSVLSGDLSEDDGPNFTGNDENSRHVVKGDMGNDDSVLDGFIVTAGNSTGFGTGGGIELLRNGSDIGTPEIRNCRIEKSIATWGGGVYISQMKAIFSSCIIVSNRAGTFGGGVRIINGNGVFSNCLIEANRSNSGGGGVALSSSVATFVNTSIQGNYGRNTGGGLHLADGNRATLINCTIQGNRSPSGSAVRDNDGTGAQRYYNNTIIWNNVGSATARQNSFSSLNPTGVTLNHCLVEHFTAAELNTNGMGGAGNLDGTLIANDPGFLSPVDPALAPLAGGDLRLSFGSPAIDQGLNATNTSSVDLAGNPRIQNAIIDLGAYEYDSAPPAVVSITTDETGPVRASNLIFQIRFNESVVGFDAFADLALQVVGTANAVGATVVGTGDT
ncbi:MAG: choice-of-anchor Q domain-containing protein [Verrucomicrobiota bacterium]